MKFPPQTRTEKHQHLSRCIVKVCENSGPVWEVRNHTKTYHQPGAIIPELPSDEFHIMGNDGPKDVFLVAIYEPKLVMKTVDDNPLDIFLCNTPGVPTQAYVATMMRQFAIV